MFRGKIGLDARPDGTLVRRQFGWNQIWNSKIAFNECSGRWGDGKWKRAGGGSQTKSRKNTLRRRQEECGRRQRKTLLKWITRRWAWLWLALVRSPFMCSATTWRFTFKWIEARAGAATTSKKKKERLWARVSVCVCLPGHDETEIT